MATIVVAPTEPASSAPFLQRPEIIRWFKVFAVMSATILEILDTSVVNVSLPHIAGSLSATTNEATWVLTSYIAANAMVLPLTGWLSNFFGRRRLLLTVVTGFTVSSMLCGIAPNLPLLVFFRVMQGITGGGLQPLSQSVLLETFPPEERGKAMSYWGLGVVVAPILGPTLGGWITENYSWRWVFYINLPIGIASLVLIYFFIYDPSYIQRGTLKIDGWGIGMLAIGMASMQIMLDKGQEDDWFSSNFIITLTICAAILLPLFVIRQLYEKNPLVKLQLFNDRNFACGIAIATVMNFVLYGSLVLVPLFMQTLLGWSSMTAGKWTGPRGVGALLGMVILGRNVVKRFDGRKFVIVGFGVTGFIFFTYAKMNLNSGTYDIMIPQFFQGLAMSLAFVPLTTLTTAFVTQQDMSYATSLYNTMRNIGSSIGISFVATFLERRTQFHRVRLVENVSLMNSAAQKFLAVNKQLFQFHGSDPYSASLKSLARLNGLVDQQASLLSFLDAFWLLGILFLVIIPLPFFMRRAGAKKA
jgi:MFS transporter, DHA2 family, multidrug resistance protein